jgi:hypothetical protein
MSNDRPPSAAPGGRAAGAPPPIASAKQIVLGTLAALVAAAILLVFAVLPAEYGVDLTGLGGLVGLTQLANVRPGVVALQAGEHKVDSARFVLGPFQFIEYKYRLEKGASMVYSWTATGQVMAQLHSEPDGAPLGYAETFDTQQGTQGAGAYTAPFSGIHGWYWENVDQKDVTITVATAGFYSAAAEIFSGGDLPHALTDLHGRKLPAAPATRARP